MVQTLRIIFDRGLIGIYCDWCESLNTYPRTYDLLHPAFLFQNLTERCDIVDVVVEMDRLLRPDGAVVMQDTAVMIKKMRSILHSFIGSPASTKKSSFLVKKVSDALMNYLPNELEMFDQIKFSLRAHIRLYISVASMKARTVTLLGLTSTPGHFLLRPFRST